MATQIQFRRGTAAEHSTFTGAEGEMTIDTTNDRVVVHDGSTAGGFPMTGAPASSTDNAIARFDGTAGKLQNSSGATISDTFTLALSPTTGLNLGVNISQSASGTPSQVDQGAFLASGWNFNQISVIDTGVDTTGFASGQQNVNALRVAYNSSGGADGIGQGVFATVNIYGAPAAASNTFNQYVAGQFIGQTSVNLGGTNTGAGAVGAIFGIGATGQAVTAATYLLNVTGAEISGAIGTSSSSKSFSNLSLAQHDNHQVSGATYDASLSLSKITGALGVINGILFSDYNGDHPVKTTGTLIATQGSATVANGIDLSSYTITGSAFKSPSFNVLGSGYTGVGIAADSSVPLLVIGNSSAANLAQRLYVSDNGAALGPELQFWRESTTPAASDILGVITFVGKDDGGNRFDYAQVGSDIVAATDASEDGEFWVKTGGTKRIRTNATTTTVTNALSVTGAVTLSSTVNKVTVTAPASSATLTISDGGSLITSGGHSLTLTTTGATNVTLPTSGTLVNSAVTSLSSLATVGTITSGTWNAGAVTSSSNIVSGGFLSIAPAAANSQFFFKAPSGAYSGQFYFQHGETFPWLFQNDSSDGFIFKDNIAGVTIWSVANNASGAMVISATGGLSVTNSAAILTATAIPAGGGAGSGYKFSSTSNFGVFFGSGAPSLSAAKGSLYLRSDGSGTTDRAYINTNGSTTWTALTTAA